MANTRSKVKETDRGQSSRSQSGLDAKLMKRAGNSNSSMRSSDLKNSNETTSSSSPLRRSQRETPTKKASQSSPTSQKSTPNSARRTSSRRKSLNLIANQRSSAKGVSSSRDSKKKSEGKKKAIAENNQSRSKDKKATDDGDDSNSNSNSDSSGNENTRELPKKRKRVLLHAKTYKEFFNPIPRLKRPKPSDDQASKKDELKSNRDENNEDDTVIISGEPSKLRVRASPSSTTKSSKEESLSRSKENEISQKDLRNVEIQVVLVPEELASRDRDILALPVKPIPPVPIEENEIMVIDDEPPTDQQFDGTVCCVCKKAGTLLSCEGRECKTKYHLTCMEPPIQEPPPGIWLCIPCVKKKIQFGAHSVSKGIESIWDVKDGSQNGKQYFVKYKNLAHVHNKWVSETEALREAPDLLSKFTCKFQKEKTSKWKQEWKEPERLLKRRTLMPDEMADDFFDGPADKIAYCNGEWLVKWKDLGYEHATWELETSEFLCNDEALTLISDFEARRDRAKLSSDPSSAFKVLELKKAELNKLEKLPAEYPYGLDNDNVISTNRLREFWHKSQNAVFIDEQERIIKTILFIISVISDVCRPIIIVSNVNSLPLWESKFNRLAPKINVVTYTGTKKVRKLIKDTEFYEEGGCIMFQVLLSHPDAILEDLETLDCIGWEAVIVDECQTFRTVAKNLEKFKSLSADFRLLLLSSRLKAGLSSRPNDIISEYVNILAYLDPNNETGLPYTSEKEKTSMLEILKDRFACHVAYERALPETSKFIEYWVPVPMSNVQLELYTSTLISNSNALRSFSRIDHIGALRDTLITLRKCCDHPYLVDQDLQGELMKERPVSEILNIGVQACGKFLLFDKLLKDMHARGLRVIILFQAGGGGSGRNKIGDFLDDFLRQRFGIDSYEHIEKGLSVSKRQTAMNNFNNKAMGRFAFLIENRACMPSVKLSSVDAVLIYDSEWNPMNDLRAIQKISIQPEPVLMPIFRLYSFCAVEEKVLIQAKQDILLDSDLQGVVPSVSQSLLSWGASYLFRSLAKPYQSDELVSPSTVRFLDQVSAEILSKIGQQSICGTNGGNLLTEAKVSGTTYSRNSGKLEGEKVGLSSLEGDPNLFWSGLLEGTNPQWRFVHAAEPAQRSRRKVQLFDSLDKSQGVVCETDESRKKKRRNGDDVGTSGGTGVASPRSKAGMPLSIRNISCEELASPSNRPTQPGPQIINLVEDDPLNLKNAQRSLLLLLKPQLINLCQAAGLPEYVTRMAEKLLEHIIQNFQVDPEPENILQAFVLSLVRDLKENSKRRSSINFNVDPDPDPQRFLHAHLLSLCWRAASLFKHWLDVGELVSLASDFLRYNCEKNHVESIYIRLQDLKTEFQSEADEILASQDPPSRFHNQLFKIPKREITNPTEPSREDVMLQNRIELIEKVFARRQKAILSKHQYVLSQIEKFGEREKLRIGTTGTAGTGTEKERLQRKMIALEDHIKNQFKRLEAEDIRRLEAEKNLRDEWVRKAKSGSLEDDFDNVPLHDSGFCIDEFVWVCSEDLQTGTRNNNNSLGEARGEIVNNSELVEITCDDEPINEETVVNEEIVNNGEINENEEIEEIIMEEETVNGDMEQNTSSDQPVQNTGTGQESPSSDPTPPVIPVEAEPVPVPVPVPVQVQPPVSVPRTNDHTVAGTSDHTIAHDVARQSTAPNNATLETNSSPLLQMLPMVFAQSLSSDPLKNELMRIKQQDDLLTKRYEYQRQKVQNELEEELEKVKKKYEAILNSSESSFQQQKQLLGDVYNKIIINQSLAEEFRAKFIEHRGAPTNNNNASSSQGAARNAVPIQPRPNQVPVPPRPNQIPVPQPAPALVPPRPNQVPVPPRPHQAPVLQSTAPIATTSSTTTATPHLRPRSFPLPPVHPSAGPSNTPASTPPIPTISPVRPSTPLIPNRPQFNAANLGPRTSIEQRAPAPHLSRFRPSPSSSSAPTDQNNHASAMDKLRAMLASRSGTGTGTGTSTGTGNENLGTSGQRSNTVQAPPSEVRAMWLQYLASTNNGSGQTGTGQTVENGDAVVCLSDDD